MRYFHSLLFIMLEVSGTCCILTSVLIIVDCFIGSHCAKLSQLCVVDSHCVFFGCQWWVWCHLVKPLYHYVNTFALFHVQWVLHYPNPSYSYLDIWTSAHIAMFSVPAGKGCCSHWSFATRESKFAVRTTLLNATM